MRRTTALGLSVFLLAVPAAAQKQFIGKKQETPKHYWLKYSLAFFPKCHPRVYPNNITFDEGCKTDGFKVEAIQRDTQVLITAIKKEKAFTKVSFNYAQDGYEIFLKSNSRINYQKAFRLLFSEKELTPEELHPSCHLNPKTKEQLLRCIGFPIEVRRERGLEKYCYDLAFVGFMFYGFHDWCVEVKGNKVLRIYGSI